MGFVGYMRVVGLCGLLMVALVDHIGKLWVATCKILAKDNKGTVSGWLDLTVQWKLEVGDQNGHLTGRSPSLFGFVTNRQHLASQTHLQLWETKRQSVLTGPL